LTRPSPPLNVTEILFVDQPPEPGRQRVAQSDGPHQLTERMVLALERIADALARQTSASVTAVQAEALSKADAARFLGVDEATIEQLIRTRKLAYVQHGSQRGRVITVEALRAFLQEYRQATGEELMTDRKRKG
jgi:DNA-directed RNA polymerase specialized sigma24 family protein